MTTQQLIEDNIKLVYHVINRKYPTFRYDEDLIQCGMMGLCKAANTWDESKSKFSTYAVICINNEMCKEFKRRAKYNETVSLNRLCFNETDDEFVDFLIGEEDVDYVDVEAIIQGLSPKEKEVFHRLQEGWLPEDVTAHYGWSKQRTHQIMRKIRLLWRKYNGDSN